MGKRRRKTWEIDIGMKKPQISVTIDRFHQKMNKSIDYMQRKANKELNPLKHSLSAEAQKRLKWMYIIQFECGGNTTKASRKIGISRQWLSKIYNLWIKSEKAPCVLEPKSKAPKSTDKRKKISQVTEDKIIEVRKKYHWGKDKLVTVLDRDHDIQVGASTINRYLSKHGLLDIKISNRIKNAH